jgi:hypothetical protein
MYFSRASSACELIRITFSVMLSIVRSFKIGTSTLGAGCTISTQIDELATENWEMRIEEGDVLRSTRRDVFGG